jgi:hypothetical protein
MAGIRPQFLLLLAYQNREFRPQSETEQAGVQRISASVHAGGAFGLPA